MDYKALTKAQVSKKIENIQEAQFAFTGVKSWINYIRAAYGMSLRQLANRCGITKTALHRLEKAEIDRKINMGSLMKIAAALNCKLVYGFVPLNSVEAAKDKQARMKANEIITQSTQEMEMEDQAVSKEELQIQFQTLIKKIKQSRKLWD